MLSYFALITRPRKELQVAELCRDAGITALVPTVYLWPQVRGRRKRATTPQLFPRYSRYVFAGFKTEPDWLTVRNLDAHLQRDIICGVVGFEGRPAQLPRKDVWRLMEQEADDVDSSAVSPHKAFKKGDEAEIVDGPFGGHIVKIEDIIAGNAKVLMGLFGAPHVTKVALDNLQVA